MSARLRIPWPPPDPETLANRFEEWLRGPEDLNPMGCCDIPWSQPHHAIDCRDRCMWCGSEGPDNDHRAGCPTIGTCAQTHPNSIPPEHWHPEPDTGWAEWYVEHFKLLHPEVRRWHP